MPINPDDYYARGETPTYRRPAAVSGGVLSARFYENPGTSGHLPIDVGASGAVMRWSGMAVDNLGMGSDWGHDPQSGTFYFSSSGYYLIVLYIQIEPEEDVEWTFGMFEVVLQYNDLPDPEDDWWEQGSGVATNPGVKINLTALHRIDLEAQPGAGFSVDVNPYAVSPATGTVTRATISITKLGDLA